MCKVAINGGYCRGSNSFHHLLQRGGRIGAVGIFYARVYYAWRQALRMFVVPRYSRRKRWCVVTTTLRSVKYARGYLPSVESISSCASGVLAGLSLSKVPEKVARLAFPRPPEGSSWRRCPVVAEESLAEDSARSVRSRAAASRSVSLDPLRAGWRVIGFL